MCPCSSGVERCTCNAKVHSSNRKVFSESFITNCNSNQFNSVRGHVRLFVDFLFLVLGPCHRFYSIHSNFHFVQCFPLRINTWIKADRSPDSVPFAATILVSEHWSVTVLKHLTNP